MCVCGGGGREAIINIKSQKKGVAQFLVSRYQAYYIYYRSIMCMIITYMGWVLREMELHDD